MMSSPYKWPRWWFLVAGLCGGAASVGVAVVLFTRPADSGTIEPPPEVTCRGILGESGFYAGRTVRLSTVGMRPGPTPHELVYVRVFGQTPVVVARFVDPVSVPMPSHAIGRVEVPEKPPVIVIHCRPD